MSAGRVPSGEGAGRRARPPVLRLRRRPAPWARQRPTWRAASAAVIDAALEASSARPSGNWFVVAGARDLPAGRALGRTVAGREVVLWRTARGDAVAGPGACPHLGAPLAEGAVRCGALICRWHGLRLDGSAHAGWAPYPVHDDGVLLWVRLDAVGGEEPLERPVVPPRPALPNTLDAVYRGVGTCEPEDVIANRLDPWHGAWLHPYSFVDLTVVTATGTGPAPAAGPVSDTASCADADAGFVVDVSFKVAGRLVVPVRAVFTAPEPRTVVMRITEGEGAGSVVETHATPLGTDSAGRPRTAVTEAVLATSARPRFAAALRAARALRPLVRAASGRLWRDDLAYAERRWWLRAGGDRPREARHHASATPP